MTIKEENDVKKRFLNRYKNLCYKLRSLQEQEIAIKAEMESTKAIEFHDMPKGSMVKTDLSDQMIKLERIVSDIDTIKEERVTAMAKIEELISSVEDGKESKLLHDRYILGKSWESIASEIHYTYRHTLTKHGDALKHIDINDCI